MLWRHPHSVRAWSAAGFLTVSILGASAFSEPAEPVPDAEARTETVGILDARESGDLALKVRGQGHDRVKVAIRNTSSKRLRVVLPPGLVASSVTGQLQSMGLGSPTNSANSFGSYRPSGPDAGLRSVPPAGDVRDEDAVAVPAGQTVEFSMAAVCLNFGKPTPTPRDSFELMDVDRYSADPRVRKALRSLATLGTSHGVAQAAMWSVCNGIPYPMMTARFAKVVNPHEAALAARFVEALDSGGPGDLVEPAYLEEGRLFVRVGAEGSSAEDARRLADELEGLRILGLPVRVVTGDEAPAASGPALLLNIVLGPGRAGETKGRLSVRHATAGGGNWASLGQASFVEGSAPSVLDGPALARAIDRSVAGAFVAARPAKRSVGSTTLKIENRLPFTLGSVVVKAGDSAGAPSVPLTGLGIGPARSGLAPIQAAGGSVERVELNGL